VAFTYAGEYTGGLFIGGVPAYTSNGSAAFNVTILDKTSSAAATLYSDRLKTSTLGSNVVLVGASSQLTFYAAPGVYSFSYTIGGNTYTGEALVVSDRWEPAGQIYASALAMPGASGNTVDPAPTIGTHARRSDTGLEYAWVNPLARWIPLVSGATIDESTLISGSPNFGTSFTDILPITAPIGVPFRFVVDGSMNVSQGTTAIDVAGQIQYRIIDANTSTVYAADLVQIYFVSASGGQWVVPVHREFRQAALPTGANTSYKLQAALGTSTLGACNFFSWLGNATTPAVTLRTVIA
jgi:hypothetical protein